jgi:molybdopterin-guanine dinucleotide biosynthesis protein A
MGRSKAALPWGAGNLLEFQTGRLARLFREVFVVVKETPDSAFGPARIVLDDAPGFAAIHGLVRALEEADDRVFVLAVDLPAVTHDVVREIVRRAEATSALALIPKAGGRLQPLAAVWRRAAARFARSRIAKDELSLSGLAGEVGAETFSEREWRKFDPSGASFTNVNTFDDYLAHRERA